MVEETQKHRRTLKSFPLKSRVLSAPTLGNAPDARTNAARTPSLSLSFCSRSRSLCSLSAAAPPSPNALPVLVDDSRLTDPARAGAGACPAPGMCRAVTLPSRLLATTACPCGAPVDDAEDGTEDTEDRTEDAEDGTENTEDAMENATEDAEDATEGADCRHLRDT